MKTEIEAKFLDIDIELLRNQLKNMGASLIYPEHITTTKVFDYPDFRLDKDSSWLRVREENGKVAVTLKRWSKEGLHGMGEIAFNTDDFESTEKLFFALGMKIKSSQKKKRELWRLNDTEFMIDTWPWIPTFLEIEGKTENSVRESANKLNLNWDNAVFGGVARIYQKYFNVECEEIDRCLDIDFNPVPDWLEVKRKKN